MSAILRTPAASPAVAFAHFAGRLAVETDVADVARDLAEGVEGVVVVDVRSRESWDLGHVPGALHVPVGEIPSTTLPFDQVVVVYCWSPGCNGAQQGGAAFARLGYRVKEMIGGFEYWAKEGFPVEMGDGTVLRREVDPLVGSPQRAEGPVEGVAVVGGA
ncbi:rhodanese-like domain-containing protein [Herbidospora daliensis]|uniref:rhodanese-like domain-containing protein n=1 Tax=Herbidospora daliensis TaxID=295585 RepID=UPI0007827A56|nr:rhodanese-like domain-containing protein [Herbidospora daliensis]